MTNATDSTFDSGEWHDIARKLAGHHSIFYRFWSIARPTFSTEIKTAAVYFDKAGKCIDFKINRAFWESQTETQKLFVICHECLHLIFNHGRRAANLFKSGQFDQRRLNIAMDITINHALVERYGFSRAEVDPDDRYIWADKVAEMLGLPDLPSNRCYEYYYALFRKQPDDKFSGSGDKAGETVDDHTGDQTSDQSDAGNEVVNRMAEEMDDGELESLDNTIKDQHNRMVADAQEQPGNGIQPGTEALGHTYAHNVGKVKEKKKWEQVIRKWAEPRLKEDFTDVEQWAKTSRRFAMLDSSLSLPYDMEMDILTPSPERLEVWFFLDTSGSCIQLAPRFFKAAKSLPKRRFDVNLFCFDTKVYESDLKKKEVKGGGGTKFDILEAYIQKHGKKKYPDAVFIITDGWGNNVYPKNPKVWHWFLSEDCRRHIPPASQVHMLRDYE